MKAVIDASVLVSAFLFPESVPGLVFERAGNGQYRLCLSPVLREETKRSLSHPRLQKAYGYSASAVEDWLVRLDARAERFTGVLPDIERVRRDLDDHHVLAAGIAMHAEWIVTGDKDLLTLARYTNISIVTARDFLSLLEKT